MIFRDDRLAIPFEPRTGIRLVAHGRVDVFEPQGAYQLYVDALQPAGFGDLALRFEALKAQLTAEGLFEAQPQAAAARRGRGRSASCTSRCRAPCSTTSARSSRAAGRSRASS